MSSSPTTEEVEERPLRTLSTYVDAQVDSLCSKDNLDKQILLATVADARTNPHEREYTLRWCLSPTVLAGLPTRASPCRPAGATSVCSG